MRVQRLGRRLQRLETSLRRGEPCPACGDGGGGRLTVAVLPTSADAAHNRELPAHDYCATCGAVTLTRLRWPDTPAQDG